MFNRLPVDLQGSNNCGSTSETLGSGRWFGRPVAVLRNAYTFNSAISACEKGLCDVSKPFDTGALKITHGNFPVIYHLEDDFVDVTRVSTEG